MGRGKTGPVSDFLLGVSGGAVMSKLAVVSRCRHGTVCEQLALLSGGFAQEKTGCALPSAVNEVEV